MLPEIVSKLEKEAGSVGSDSAVRVRKAVKENSPLLNTCFYVSHTGYYPRAELV